MFFYCFERWWNWSAIISSFGLKRFDSKKSSVLFYSKWCWLNGFFKSWFNYCYKAGKSVYSCKMLLWLVLIGAFDGKLSGREVTAKATADVS